MYSDLLAAHPLTQPLIAYVPANSKVLVKETPTVLLKCPLYWILSASL